MAKYKAAVIGVFNIGKQHVKAWSKTEGAELVAIADLNPQLCESVKQEFQLSESYLDYKEMLKHSEVEVVSVCLPTGLHEQVVTDCLRAGRHVICEKPPSTSAQAAERMYECSVKTGRQLGYSLQRRFSGQVEAVRRAVVEAQIGEVFYAKTGWVRHAPLNLRESMWRFDRKIGGGSLLDLGVHLLDAAWYALGCPQPVAASGHVSSAQVPEYCRGKGQPMPEMPADDTAAAWIRFANGLVLTLESSYGLWTLDDKEVYCDLHGTEGALRMYPGKPAIVTREGKATLEEPAILEAQHGVTSDFIRALEEKRLPCANSMQGIVLHQMLDAILQSADEGREVKILG
jgi:predicted dehydrogenase